MSNTRELSVRRRGIVAANLDCVEQFTSVMLRLIEFSNRIAAAHRNSTANVSETCYNGSSNPWGSPLFLETDLELDNSATTTKSLYIGIVMMKPERRQIVLLCMLVTFKIKIALTFSQGLFCKVLLFGILQCIFVDARVLNALLVVPS